MFRLFLFGSPVLLTNNQEPIHIRRKRGMALLAYLALQKRPQSREALATLLWPDYEQSKAFANLRRELARLKADTGEGLLYIDRQTIGIDPEADLWVDVLAFTAGADSDDPTSLAEVIQLYTDHFMVGLTIPDSPPFDEWQFFQTESLQATYATTLQRFLETQNQAQDYQGAVETARRWLQLDTLHEPAHRSLMLYYALSGQLSAAVRQYHICARTLETELGIEPEPETTALFEAIQNKQFAPPDPVQIDLAVEPEPVPQKAPARRHNLPQMADAFIGRQQKIKEIHHYLTQTDARLVTVRGLGGIGKTRLALQAATELIETEHFPDGLFLVNLAGVENADYLISTIAEALNFPLSKADSPTDQLINYLQNKEMVLLLDNFEQLGRTGAAQIALLLQKCPQLKMLVTSRHQLNLAGEYVFELSGLPLPQGTRGSSSALRLFESRATQLSPHLDLQKEQPFIRAICRLVDGMPLAIEMCAAWVNTLTCQEILQEIQQGLDLLESGQGDRPERHQSIRAVFQSSFKLLAAGEQETLLALALFRGSFNYLAAKQVAGATLIQLRSLVEKSLLSTVGNVTETRYQMHPLLRQFGLEAISAEKLAAGERRHAQYFAGLLNQLDQKKCSVDHELVITSVITEADNLRNVWRWLSQQAADNYEPEFICQLLEHLLPAWSFAHIQETRYLEGKQTLNQIWQSVNHACWETAESPRQQWVFALLSTYLGQFCVELSQFEEGVHLIRRALAILQPLYKKNFRADKTYLVESLRTWARADIRMGNYSQAEEKLLESIDLAEGGLSKAWSLYTLAILFSNTGRYDQALAIYPQALNLFEQCHDQRSVLITTSSIGSVYGRQRKFEEAIGYFEKVASLARQLGQQVTLMVALANLAFCLKEVGRTRRVDSYFNEALAVANELGIQRWQAVIAQDFGRFLLEQGDMQSAKQHLKSGLELSVTINSEPDVLAGLLSMAQYQAQIGRFEEALAAAGFVMANQVATAENQSYAADFWDELSSELPPIFTQRAQAKLENATLDDVLAIMKI